MRAIAYIGRVFAFALRGFTIRTDGMQVLAASLVPLLAPYLGVANPSQASSEALAYIGMAALAFFAIRLVVAPYRVWLEDQAEIARLENELDEPERREAAALTDHRLQLRRELADRLAELVTIAQYFRIGRGADAVVIAYSEKLTATSIRISELVSQLSYDVVLRVASLNLHDFCLSYIEAVGQGKDVSELTERLWAQRKLTFRILHRQNEVSETFSLAELENMIVEFGESFHPKKPIPDNYQSGYDAMDELRKKVKEFEEVGGDKSAIRKQLGVSKSR